MTKINPDICSCCNNIWNIENLKNIKLGKYELHLCPDCYREYIISNNKVLNKIRTEIEFMDFDFGDYYDHTDEIIEKVLKVFDKCEAEIDL